jgi:hypothetical protein
VDSDPKDLGNNKIFWLGIFFEEYSQNSQTKKISIAGGAYGKEISATRFGSYGLGAAYGGGCPRPV